ncbi:hypothetical protein OCU04_002418 [Sclerotinia nivalis]|uniref:Uncharacterized protein n=1 Tax=Sclerotinia nivalis TaxID=352851 RepID=A0A9X0DMJ7_9HELO|nr:hypothetical protein OCU04_002418 [Sclerotinia nivalis]
MSLPHALGIIRTSIGGKIASGVNDIQNGWFDVLIPQAPNSAQSPLVIEEGIAHINSMTVCSLSWDVSYISAPRKQVKDQQE